MLACEKTAKFEKIENRQVIALPDNKFFIRLFNTDMLPICVATCASDCECSFFIWRGASCGLYKLGGKFYLRKGNEIVYQKMDSVRNGKVANKNEYILMTNVFSSNLTYV